MEPRIGHVLARRLAVTSASVLVLACAVAACGWTPGFGSNLSDTEKLHQQAQAALTRWATAIGAAGPGAVVLVGDLTAQRGDWEVAVGDNNKRALMAGLLEMAAGVPSPASPTGTVIWRDGTTAEVRLLSAADALARIRRGADGGECPDCQPLQVTAARLGSIAAATSRGTATVPAWTFSLRGTDVSVTHVAIADPVTANLPWGGVPWGNAEEAPVGISVDAATTSGAGRGLIVRFVGAPLPGDQPCGADYTAEAVESSLAVVVIVTAHPNAAADACDASGAVRTATVSLAAPLGARTVLEVREGRPVAVELAP